MNARPRNIRQQALALHESQVRTWPLLEQNWKDLEAVEIKHIRIDGVPVRVQFNPRRIVSSSARVDKRSIEERPCFLCRRNRPPEQESVSFGEDLEILCNPFPIFKLHYTVATLEHIPQEIDPWYGRFLDLSRALQGFAVFYNAPACGASAPDHMHFQAGETGLMPIEDQLQDLMEESGERIAGNGRMEVTAVEDGFRRFVVMESHDKAAMEEAFGRASGWLRQLQGGEEPMINMLSYYPGKWQVLLFPRSRHRPRQYFEEGEENILLSPASVDMGGTLITPLEKDFEKIGSEAIKDIFSQVCLPEPAFKAFVSYLKTHLA